MVKCLTCGKPIRFYQEVHYDKRYHIECFNVANHTISGGVKDLDNKDYDPLKVHNNTPAETLVGDEEVSTDLMSEMKQQLIFGLYRQLEPSVNTVSEQLLQKTKDAGDKGLCLLCSKNKANPVCNDCLIKVVLGRTDTRNIKLAVDVPKIYQGWDKPPSIKFVEEKNNDPVPPSSSNTIRIDNSPQGSDINTLIAEQIKKRTEKTEKDKEKSKNIYKSQAVGNL